MRSDDYLNMLYDQVIPLIDCFFPDYIGTFQDDDAKIRQAETVNEWFRVHQR